MKYTLLSAITLSLFTHMVSADTRSITYMPKGGYLSTTQATYVDPSQKTVLIPGQKISDLTTRNYAGDTITQRLTERSYWIQNGFYSTIAYVGDKGVLLMDPLGYGRGKAVLSAVKKITDKPVTAVIYSHHHEDHIGDVTVFVEAAKTAGVDLRIIATQTTAEGMLKKSKLPAATEILTAEKNTTKFEGETITAVQITPAAHTHDSTVWKLEGEKIVHIPDYVNPDQMPYLGFGGSETFVGFEENLKQIRDMGFTYYSGGHGNIGSPADFDFMLTYIDDLKKAIPQALGKVSRADYTLASHNNHQASGHLFFDAFTKAAMDILRPKYGDFYGFEASVPHQIRMVRDSLND